MRKPHTKKNAVAVAISFLLTACGGGDGASSVLIPSTGSAATPASSANTGPSGAAGSVSTGGTASGPDASSGATASANAGNGAASGGTDSGSSGYQYDATARFGEPRALVPDDAGNLYVFDRDNPYVRRITPDGRVATMQDMTLASMTFAPDGSMYVIGGTQDGPAVMRVTADGTRTRIRSYKQGPGAYSPTEVVADRQGQLYVVMNYRNQWYVQRIDPSRVDDDSNDVTVYSVSTWGALNGISLNPQGDLAASVYDPASPPAQKVFLIPRTIQPAHQNFVSPSASNPDTPGILTVFSNADSEQAIAYDRQGNLYVFGFVRHPASGGTNPDGTPAGTTSDMHLTRIGADGSTALLLNGFPDGSTSPRPGFAPGNAAIAVGAAGDIYFSFDHAIFRRSASGQTGLFAGKPGESGTSD